MPKSKKPVTIKSLSDALRKKLCKVPIQDFVASAVVRDMYRAVDPSGTKNLTRRQAQIVKSFLEILVATAYK